MRNTLFAKTGVHALVDGQFGSTGKGALAAWLAERAALDYGFHFEGVISNAGPNSGHTFYYEGEKHVLKQLPTFSVASYLGGNIVPAYLSAGAVIDPEILSVEAYKYPGLPIFVHPNAVLVTHKDRTEEHSGTVGQVAGTHSGTGAAIARKVMRDPWAVFGSLYGPGKVRLAPNVTVMNHKLNPAEKPYFMEVSQGFSLGINSEFYPKCTSRECTVMQGLSDARVAPRHLVRTYLSVRTFPIRVGNDGDISSGGWYPDQEEITWEYLGQQPELTTVTQRVRRVATFSQQQFDDAVAANDPDFVFLNFLNYLDKGDDEQFLQEITCLRDNADKWFDVIGGWGATSADIRLV